MITIRVFLNKTILVWLTAWLMLATTSAMATSIAVTNAWAAAQSDTNRPGAVFMEITNSGNQDDILLSIDTPIAKSAQTHKTKKKNEKMRMRKSKGLDIPAGSTVVLKHNALHVMLMGVLQPLVKGTSFPLTLNFEKDGAITIEVPVKSMDM